MRLRIILLVLAISSLILVSFLLPLALLLRTFAAERAVDSATIKTQWMAPLVATLSPSDLRLTVAQVNAADPAQPITVYLPGKKALGAPAARSRGVELAARGRSFTEQSAGGMEVLVAVQGLPTGTAVIRTFVTGAQLRQGVARAWLLLGLIGLGLLGLSVLVSAQLARSLVRPLRDVARVADMLAQGDLTARSALAGPPEVRHVSKGLNRLAARIGELLAHERETLADLSHRLRTPLTALRIDAEAVRDTEEMSRIVAGVEELTRALNEIIREARRPAAAGGTATCDAAAVVRNRAAFWHVLAEDQERRMMVDIPAARVPVLVPAQDLAACADILLENVFAHTPEGTALAVRVSSRPGGGAWLTVTDDGPGFADPDLARRGQSAAGSTGLGLDIARRIAAASGGSLTLGRSPRGGGAVIVGLGPAEHPARTVRHMRTRPRPLLRRRAAADARLAADLAEWSAYAGREPDTS